MDIEIKKSTKPVKYNDAISHLEARSKLVSKNEDKELIWILEHDPIFTAGTNFSKNDYRLLKKLALDPSPSNISTTRSISGHPLLPVAECR